MSNDFVGELVVDGISVIVSSFKRYGQNVIAEVGRFPGNPEKHVNGEYFWLNTPDGASKAMIVSAQKQEQGYRLSLQGKSLGFIKETA